MKTAMVRGKRAVTMTAVALVAAVSSGVSAAASLPEGGAEATGGSGVAEVAGQDTALNGRQNNACGNVPAFPGIVFDGRSQADCAVADRSERTGVLDTAGGATATGGDGAVYQQNTAERGRQNNACGNHNSSFGMTGTTDADCTAADTSWSRGVVHRGDGAAATGGDGGAYQQNTAQEGRQNNSCGNANTGSLSGTAEAECAAVDASVSRGVTRHSGGATANGGSGLSTLFQQNTAQEGRQNNSCGNINGLALESGRTQARCSAVDTSAEHRTGSGRVGR